MQSFVERLVPILRHCVALAAVAAVLVGATHWWTPVCVAGNSMHPALHAGDLALVRRGAKPAVGAVALIEAPGHGPVLHRVVGVESDGRLKTRGDANPVADRDAVSRTSVRGTVGAVIPVGKMLAGWRDGR